MLTSPASELTPLDALFAGGGEMGRRMRAHDWSRHPLGPPEDWPQSLRSTLRLMLGSRYPMFVGWGPELFFFYNDAYIPVLGARHPRGLGEKMSELWAELWPVIGPQTQAVIERGESTWNEQMPLLMERNGFSEETYFTFSYSPATNDEGHPCGVFCVCTEETGRVLGERRLALLRELAGRISLSNTEAELWRGCEAVLAQRPQDTPIALLYLFSPGTHQARLTTAHGLERGSPLAPESLDTASPQALWKLGESNAEPIALPRSLDGTIALLPRPTPHRAVLVPITRQDHAEPVGFFVIGLNPRRPFDADYRGFLNLLAGQVSAALVNVRARETEHRQAEAFARIRHEAAEKVRESEERFRHVADNSPTIFWVADQDGKCVYLNDRWYEYTGQAEVEAIGFGWLEPIHPDDRPRTEKIFLEANREQRTFQVEYRLRRHDDVYRWVIDSGAPRFIDGTFVGFVGSVLDITEKREEVALLERNRSQMKLALEAGRSGTFEWHIPSGRVEWSPELERLYGLEPGAFKGTFRAWAQHVEPEDLPVVEQVVQRCFEHRIEEAEYEFRVILPDGTRRWLEGKARFTFAPNGTPRQMVGINIDADDRKRAELNLEFLNRLSQDIALLSDPVEILRTTTRQLGQHLKAHRCYFFALNERAPEAIVEHDWTREASAGSMMGSYPITDFGAPDYWTALTTRRLAIGDTRENPLCQSRREQHAERHVLAFVTAPYIRDGRWVATLAVTQDRPRNWREDENTLVETVLSRVWPLVERARSEQAVNAAETKIRESEERLRTAVEAARLGTWAIHPQTYQVTWDARCKELFGLPPDALADYAFVLSGIHPDDRLRVDAAVQRALQPEGDGLYDDEFRTIGLRDGGVPRWVRASGRASFKDGQPVRFVGTALDITELVQARETLTERRAELERLVAERTARLQETVAELEGFSYSISHDLRAPLRAMQSFAQLLSDECGGDVSAVGQDYLRRIINASARMDRLIHDVLVYSRVARTELKLTPVDLQALIEGIVESYPQFQPATADIVIARDLPRVLGNEAALTQCISNLIGNAVKFVAPGVRPRVEISASTHHDRVHLCVKDNGIGIPADAHEKIFGIFERLSRSYEGTGIGLAVVRKAAERMGGRITVESEPGSGSTFCLELPKAP